MTQKELTLLNLGDSLDNISNIDPEDTACVISSIPLRANTRAAPSA